MADQIPMPAGFIWGQDTVFQGQTGITYKVPPIGYADTYVWKATKGFVIRPTSEKEVITVDYGPLATSGYITVCGKNDIGKGEESKKIINVIPEKNAPLTRMTKIQAKGGDIVSMPITVLNFSDIKAITLRIDYNSELLTFDSCELNDVIGGAITHASEAPDVSDTTWKFMLAWSDIHARELAANDTLFTLNFKYNGGGDARLRFNNSIYGGCQCEYAGSDLVALIDSPTSFYYQDGYIIEEI